LQHFSLSLLHVVPHAAPPELEEDDVLELVLDDEVLVLDEVPELVLDEDEALPVLDEVEDDPLLVDPVEVTPEVEVEEEVDPSVVVVVEPPVEETKVEPPQPGARAAPARRSERREARCVLVSMCGS
jgi:hypothetical protein